MKLKVALSAAVLALAVANGAMADSTPKFSGSLLVDAKGMTLYTFDKDAAGKSNCNGACAAAWPPAAVAAGATAEGELTLVTRDDGTRQWAFNGSPLYRFAGDAQAGDVNGDNRGNVWHIVKSGRPAGASSTSWPMGSAY
jgi:predicted lipoprotein with Yx(FWY)xxD motif